MPLSRQIAEGSRQSRGSGVPEISSRSSGCRANPTESSSSAGGEMTHLRLRGNITAGSALSRRRITASHRCEPGRGDARLHRGHQFGRRPQVPEAHARTALCELQVLSGRLRRSIRALPVISGQRRQRERLVYGICRPVNVRGVAGKLPKARMRRKANRWVERSIRASRVCAPGGLGTPKGFQTGPGSRSLLTPAMPRNRYGIVLTIRTI